jgi:LmbE family N-acetylglucosaminyl deacetylase
MEFIDFTAPRRDRRLSLFFPGWEKGEGVAFYSPHDDDALIGAGYLILAAARAGATPSIFVFCRGDAGYSTPRQKKDIVARRKNEAVLAYGLLGVAAADIHFFDVPDFSLLTKLDRRHPWGKGVFDKVISLLRRKRIDRVVFSNGHLEHWDHTAVFYAGIYTSPQAQDPILADLGKPHRIQTYLAYSVWGDFEPSPGEGAIRADLGILAAAEDENRMIEAIKKFSSQSRIIKDIVALRKERRTKAGYLELYKSYTLRQPIDYSPYFEILRKLKR